MEKKLTSRDLQALETEKKVTDMAMKLVREYGYDKVTISQICDACGVAKGTFYSYFSSKKDILIKMTSRFNKELSQLFIFDESLSAVTLYQNMVTSYLNYVNKDGHAFTKSYIKAMIDEELATENVSLELQKNFIDKVILKGLKDGDFQLNMTCDDFFALFSATLMGILTQWCMSKEEEKLIDMGQRALFPIINLMKKP
ncbi:MAG TPA: TetR/AcrR family transcriptional regulator [Sedimentibacter sp.]|jgi:AcrR family transcriptional regulator|nr:TetR/AcrR family transcriptional regulator [Sedimentibacter sp.]HHZ00203.1 TetR/AcrR family transcriptional regulator [Tissierellia bacterium]HOK49718.1 TetR/AcrR family transcriptional regulator [Sedimentibacter sp.]HOW23591.1 TetR/AcrR family transcriptional regulator [Sedimentibacter sp.]HRC81528.1 TetR/AcrR family transcriptional regulator [Sedimentibacter sp.]